MLKIHFINVADGDSILIEDLAQNPPFRMLVDAGNPEMKPASKASMRQTCDQYLSSLNIHDIDLLVITHLHLDHFGGLQKAIAHREIKELCTAYLPKKPGGKIEEEPLALKTICGMIEAVNRWSADVAALKLLGCKMQALTKGKTVLQPTADLKIEIIVPDAQGAAHQHDLWDGMMAGEAYSEEDKFRASKNRNPCSLRLRLSYAGRSIELPGDCYGEIWENDAQGCDILKLPHHGDAKSMTETLAKRLSPRYAVISCANEYVPEKDRPSPNAVAMLRNLGARVWYTDSYDDGVQTPSMKGSLEFAITRTGEIICPD